MYAPRCVSRGETFLVQVFAYLAPDTQAVDDLARTFDTRARRRAYTCLDLAVRHGQRLTFHVMAEGCSIDQPVRHVVWAGRTAPMQFAMHIDPRFARNAIIGKVSICLDGVPVGHLVFTLAIRVTGNDGRQADVSARVYRQVFISYASADRAEVIKRVQMLSTLRINYFQDILHLDPGDRWEQKLYRHIDQADLFLLFWSSAARNSKWVRKEIRYALDRKGPRDSPPEIVPVVIEGPPPPAPWPELENLHLTDRLLYLMSGA